MAGWRQRRQEAAARKLNIELARRQIRWARLGVLAAIVVGLLAVVVSVWISTRPTTTATPVVDPLLSVVPTESHFGYAFLESVEDLPLPPALEPSADPSLACDDWQQWFNAQGALPADGESLELTISANVGVRIDILSIAADISSQSAVTESSFVQCETGGGFNPLYETAVNLDAPNSPVLVSMFERDRTWELPPNIFTVEGGATEGIVIYPHGEAGYVYDWFLKVVYRADGEQHEARIGQAPGLPFRTFIRDDALDQRVQWDQRDGTWTTVASSAPVGPILSEGAAPADPPSEGEAQGSAAPPPGCVPAVESGPVPTADLGTSRVMGVSQTHDLAVGTYLEQRPLPVGEYTGPRTNDGREALVTMPMAWTLRDGDLVGQPLPLGDTVGVWQSGTAFSAASDGSNQIVVGIRHDGPPPPAASSVQPMIWDLNALDAPMSIEVPVGERQASLQFVGVVRDVWIAVGSSQSVSTLENHPAVWRSSDARTWSYQILGSSGSGLDRIEALLEVDGTLYLIGRVSSENDVGFAFVAWTSADGLSWSSAQPLDAALGAPEGSFDDDLMYGALGWFVVDDMLHALVGSEIHGDPGLMIELVALGNQGPAFRGSFLLPEPLGIQATRVMSGELVMAHVGLPSSVFSSVSIESLCDRRQLPGDLWRPLD